MLRQAKFVTMSLMVLSVSLLQAQTGYPRSRRGIAPNTPNPQAYNVAGSFHGKLKDLSGKEIMIETDDNQIVSIHRSRKTKFVKGTQQIKASDIDLETMVTVDASEDVDLSLTALSVTVDQPKKKADSK
jgi:hypothetical protein